jgi:type II secretory pathway pseudopilin PulG
MIKNSLNQKGGAHVVIIVILLIALLGTLGFVFWQSFINKESTDAATDQKQATSQLAEEDKDLDEGYLVLKDWGIKFKLLTDSNEITYYKKQAEPNDKGVEEYYVFSTKRVEALGGQCAEPNDIGPVIRNGSISRTKIKREGEIASGSSVNNNESIADYYYYISGGQSLCANEGADIQQQDRDMIFETISNPLPY